MEKRKSLLWMSCMVVMLAVVLMLGMVGPAGATAGTQSISGVVTAEGGAPLTSMSVIAYDQYGSWGGTSYVAADGTYTISGLAPGLYYVRTSNYLGYVDEWYNDVPVMLDPMHTTVTFLDLTAGSAVADFELAAGRTISGTVTAEGGTPLEGVQVSLYDQDQHSLAYTFTAADGTYAINGVASGSFLVRTWQAAGCVNEWYENVSAWNNMEGVGATPVNVTAADAPGIDIELSAGKIIAGTVTGEGGTPLANVEVSAYSPDGTMWGGAAYTAPDGSYAITGLAPDNYKLRTSNDQDYLDEWYENVLARNNWDGDGATLIDVSSGDATGKDFALELGKIISGTVTAEGGAPLESVGIDVYVVSGESSSWWGSTSTAANGTYSMNGLTPGFYKVRTINYQGYVDEYYQDVSVYSDGSWYSASLVDASTGNAPNIDFELTMGNTVSGTVTAEGGGPLAGVYVYLYGENNSYVGSSTTGADGAYSVGGLPAGNYKANTWNDDAYLDEWYQDLPEWQYDYYDATWIDATVGNVTGIDFALAPGVTVSGTVTAVGGAPLEDVYVTAYDDYRNSLASDYTAADGTYTIEGLPPTAVALATQNDQGYIDEWYDGTPVQGNWWGDGATLVDLSGGDATGKDFELALGTSISGTVTAEGGTPLSSVEVIFYDESGDSWDGDYTDSNGAYLISGLLPGTYKVRTDNYDGYLDEWYQGLPEWQYDFEDAAWVDTTAGNATGIDFELALGQTVSGTVTTEGGAPLYDVAVVALDQDGDYHGVSWTESDGTYTVYGLAPQIYKLQTWNDDIYVDEWYGGVPVQTDLDGELATPVDLTGGDATGKDFELGEGLSISGTVSDENGEPLYDVEVDAYNLEGDYLEYTWTDPTGAYTINGLLPGSYLVATWNYDGYLDELYDDLLLYTHEPADGTPVDISSGSTGGIDFRLAEAPEPTITSIEPANGPVAGGNQVVINGTGFYRVDDLYFGDEVVYEYEVVGGTQIVVTVPAHAPGTVDVSLETVGGETDDSAADDYTYGVAYSSIRGTDRYDTAILMSQAAFPGPLPDGSGLVLAPGETYQEALCGAPLAAAYGGPVLLTPRVALNNAVRAEIVRLQPDYVICIGLSDIAKNQVQAALGATGTASMIRGTSVYQMSYLVAKALATKVGSLSGATAIITRGDMFPDAIGVAPLACAELWPILLTGSSDVLSIYASMVMGETGIREAIKVGTYARLPVTVEGVANLSGADRYHTNRNVAEWAVDNADLGFLHTALATGDKFPDALAAGPYLAKDRGVLLLSPLLGPLPPVIASEIEARAEEVGHFTFLACVEPVISQVEALLP